MKEIIFSFILYMLYDAYMRQKEQTKFLTKSEFEAWKLANPAAKISVGSNDISNFESRLKALESSAYA